MHISVAAEKIDLSDTLRARVAHHLDLIAAEYLDHAPEARVTFNRARSFFTCDIDVQAGCGLLLRGEGEAADPHGAFDDAAEHIARRLRRYRRRVNEHARALAQRRDPEVGRRYVLRPEEADDAPTDGTGRVHATIIDQRDAQIATLSVSEAVMQLELADRAVLMFRNSASAGINVVYRRPDGHVGWLDPDGARPNRDRGAWPGT